MIAPAAARPLRVLILEDRVSDAELMVRQLEKAGFEPVWNRVENRRDFVAALDPGLDVILADFALPSFSALQALQLLKDRDIRVPLIVVSGTIGEDTAVEVLRGGAADYLLKDRLGRLGQAVQRVIDERGLLEEKQQAETALRAAEDRTRFALDAARVGVWETDLTTQRTAWSATLERLHGLPVGGFGETYEAFLNCIHPGDRDAVHASIEEARRNRADWHILYRTPWPDGTTHWISETGKTFYDDAGTAVRAAGIALDVTDRHLLEEQHRQSQKVEAIGQLAGGIAHDFNNLLTAIDGYTELLSEAVGPESPHQADLGEIRRAAARAGSLTRQLLAFSRRQIFYPRVLDLRDSLRGLEPMLKRLIGENVEIVLRATEDGARVKADPGQIEQVILNLALNARDAMPDGGTLRLDVSNVELDEAYARRHIGAQPGRYVMLSVSDTGVGMDAATQAQIFEPFFTTKAEGVGTGLGLSTVHGVVQQSGGNIWVGSEPGRGSTFKVYFPQVGEPAEQPAAQPTAADLTGSETILIVEDEPGVRTLLQKALQRHGYRVLLAATPREALDIAEQHQHPIDLLMIDVVLPEMDGCSLAQQIAVSQPATRVIYMSGYADKSIVRHAAQDPDTRFLQKPFTPDVVARAVRKVLSAS